MITRRNAAGRLEEDIANVGVPSRGEQAPPLEEDMNDDKALINPPPLTDGAIKASLFQMAQVIITQAQAATLKLKP